MNRRLKKEELIYGMFDEPDDIPDYNKGRKNAASLVFFANRPYLRQTEDRI